jgi:hypothetical protein
VGVGGDHAVGDDVGAVAERFAEWQEDAVAVEAHLAGLADFLAGAVEQLEEHRPDVFVERQLELAGCGLELLVGSRVGLHQHRVGRGRPRREPGERREHHRDQPHRTLVHCLAPS